MAQAFHPAIGVGCMLRWSQHQIFQVLNRPHPSFRFSCAYRDELLSARESERTRIARIITVFAKARFTADES
jgi:hypothetical protein